MRYVPSCERDCVMKCIVERNTDDVIRNKLPDILSDNLRV